MRNICSFVRREGRFSNNQRQAFHKHWHKYGLEPTAGMVDFAQIFANSAPVYLEIGFGMGDSLFTMAQQHPENNYLGIEVHRPGVGALLDKIATNNLTNVRIYCADAIEVLQHCIPEHSFAAVLLFFPDPWPKRRHHKRRIVQPEFVSLLAQKLQLGGYFHMATDWEDYARYIQKIMSNSPEFKPGGSKYRPTSKFEQRGQRLGHQIWDLVYESKCP